MPLPWSIDNSVAAIIFLYLGDQFKRYRYQRWHWGFFILPILFIGVNELCNIEYQINMKSMIFNHWILDLVVPCIFTFILYLCSRAIAYVKFINEAFAYIGKCSITIFFVHLAFLSISQDLHPYLRVIIAVVGGILVHTVFDMNTYTRILFIGKR